MLKKDWLGIIVFPLVIFVINFILIQPYLSQSAPGWIESIELSFITLGRWWAQNFPHIWWNPYWYAGFPMRFSYVPLVPVVTAVLGSLIGDFGRAYHLLVGIAYALAPVSLFFLMRYLTKNSWAALVGALIFSLVPSQGNLFAHVRAAQGLFRQKSLPPWRMMVMVFYGEGPHTLAQVFLPLAGLFYLRALQEKNFSFTLLTSILVALAALANPIGLWATGLLLGSIFFIFFVWKDFSVEVLGQTLAIVGLAYLFSAFWYTPGFVKSDLMAESGGLLSGLLAYFPWGILAVVLFFGLVLALARQFIKQPSTAAVVFWFVFTALTVWVFYKYEIELAPQARRYIPEMDMGGAVMAAILVAGGSRLLEKKRYRFLGRLLPVVIIGLVFLMTTKTWASARWFTSYSNEYETGYVEKQMNEFLAAKVQPGERVFVSANYTFWLNMATNLWQLRGGHWQASIHPWEPHAGYQITNGQEAETSFLWLKAFAIKWLAVSRTGSPVHYADFKYPDKFMAFIENPDYLVLPSRELEKSDYVIFPSEIVYQVALTHGLAGPVALGKMKEIKEPQNGADKEALEQYVAWMEEDQTPLTFVRVHNDRYEVQGTVSAGEGIRVAMAYDKGFRAKDGQGKKLKIFKDPLGFLVIDPAQAGPVEITLNYGPTFDFYFGWLIFAGGIALAVFLKKFSLSEKSR